MKCMKNIITILLFLISYNLSSQIALRDDLLDNASVGGTWTLLSPVNPPLSALLIGDNPIIDFTPYAFGIYDFQYRVCSIAKPTICKEVETSFYSMDLGIFSSTPDSVCIEDSTINLSSLFTTFTPGANANYAWDIPNQFTYDNNGTPTILTDDTIDFSGALTGDFIIKLICTPQNPDPLIYTLDPNCSPVTYDAILNIEICCPIVGFALAINCIDN